MRWIAFGVVGAFAAALHFSIATAAVEWLRLPPLAANVIGYCCALAVSWLGQSRLTFAGAVRDGRAARRFLLTSLSGLALNTLGYAALLHWTGLDYRLALLLVLATVALLTWMAFHRWVFIDTRTRYA